MFEKKISFGCVVILALTAIILLLLASTAVYFFFWPDCSDTTETLMIKDCPNSPEEIPAPTDDWVGDDFGPEIPFPGTANGPAIANIWNEKTGFCATVKIYQGEKLDWKYAGGYWQAGSSEALKANWPHHRQRYINQSPHINCATLDGITLIPTQ